MGVSVCVRVCELDSERENGVVTSQVNKGKQLRYNRLIWPADVNALVGLNEIPFSVSAPQPSQTHIDVYVLITGCHCFPQALLTGVAHTHSRAI